MSRSARQLYICIDNAGYEVSLEPRKIYVGLHDVRALRLGHVRIVDESGEDYLYPADRFIAADLPLAARRAVLHAKVQPRKATSNGKPPQGRHPAAAAALRR
jgi:hypothetical protein